LFFERGSVLCLQYQSDSIAHAQTNLQVPRSKLGISDAHIAEVNKNDSPVDFWQFTCPSTLPLREAAPRLFSCVASAVGVERLWSACRLALTDTRRSLHSNRLVQLIKCKTNMGVLDDKSLLDRLCVTEVLSNDAFVSVFDDAVAVDEEEFLEKVVGGAERPLDTFAIDSTAGVSDDGDISQGVSDPEDTNWANMY
jgi:hypothetical protein